ARYLAANTTFHTAILDMARHDIARDILTRLGNFNFNQHFPMAFSAPVPSASEAEHERVAEAIIRGDGDEAAAAMYDHLEALIEVLQAQETRENPPAKQSRRGATRGRQRTQAA
ncbi:MAG TPA: FCD domain-containing protein, partial [Solirubrobacteraceae bacterium]